MLLEFKVVSYECSKLGSCVCYLSPTVAMVTVLNLNNLVRKGNTNYRGKLSPIES